jgi:hypothetical protein
MVSNCSIDINQLYSSLNNPSTSPHFLNPNYVEPDGPGCAWSIKIYFEGTAYQFNWFYGSQSMEISSVFGERGSARFVIADYDEEGSVLPFIPVEEQYIEVYNVNEDQLYFAGYIREVNPRLLTVRADNTEACEYTIGCTDLYHELERKPVRKVYTNKKLGFILRDVISRYTNLDASEIDSQIGFNVESYPINAKYPSQVLTHIAELTNTTYFIEPGTRKLRLLAKEDGGASYPITIGDDNLYDYFDRDTFSLRRQNDTIKNQIEFWFSERYDKGTVNVSNGSHTVVAHGDPPETDWDDLPANLQFKLANSDAIYTVQKNNSMGATQDLTLSSNFAEATATNQAYELRGNRRRLFVSDEESIGLMRSLRGDDGIFTYVVSEDQNALTWSEARRFATAMLALSRPLPQGQGTSYNTVFPFFPLQAGMVLNFNLPNSKRFIGGVVIQQLTVRDLGGEVDQTDFPSGQLHPLLQLDFTFSATMTQTQTQMRKMMQDLRKVRVNLDETAVEDYRRMADTFALKDCVHIALPQSISEGLILSDDFQASLPIEALESLSCTEELLIRSETLGPLFYTEQAHTTNLLDYSFSSD